MASRAPAEAAAAPAEAQAAPTPSRHRESPRVRTALKVSSPSDSAEREAEATAKRVMRMPAPSRIGPVLARAPLQAARAPTVSVPRPLAPPGAAAPPPKARPPEETSPELEAAIKKEKGGGRPLPADVAGFMAPRFKADFSGVRIHTGARAENLTSRLGARAFAFGRDIFFNAGQFQPTTPEGMELIAHELTHTIQQREVVQREVAADSAPVEVRESSEPQVQRGVVGEALDWIADKANYIPGFRLFTIVIGLNPVNMSRVERSGANILRALIEFIPGGGLIVDALENHGVFQKGGKFIEDQFRSLGMVGGMFRDALMEFVDSLGLRDIFRLGTVWERGKRIFTEPVKKLIDFGKGLVSGVADIVKDAILKPLGRFAASVVPKWDLLVGVFGKNPISEEGASPAAGIIGSFMELIGQGEIWKNIQQGNAVGQAWSWFKGAIAGALALVTSIPGRVMGVIRSLTIFDIVTVAGAFRKVLGAFGSFVGDFIRWAGGTVLKLLEIILNVVAPTMVPYLKKAGSAFGTIIKAPGTFIGTLVRAGKLGFGQFKKNILKHLTAGLLKWLLGSLASLNLYLPKSFELKEILKFGLSVVGLTWANLRGKLVAATNETVVKALETGFDLVTTLVREGPAAAWQQLLQSLSSLKSMVTDAIIGYVRQKVIESAIEKLVSMLTPAGAFIQAILAIYRTITFVVNKLSEIGRLVAAFIDGISALAGGVVATAANRIESVLATGLSLAISFLANFAGLGNVSKKVIEIVNKIRAPVDKALDKVVTWVVNKAKQLGKILVGKDNKPVAAAGAPGRPGPISVTRQSGAATLPDGESHTVHGAVSNGVVSLTMASGTEAQMAFVLTRLREICQRAMADYPAALKANPRRAAKIHETHQYLNHIINITRPNWRGDNSIYVAIRAISEGRDDHYAGMSAAAREAAAKAELASYVAGISGTLAKSIKLGFGSLSEVKFNSGYVDAGGTLKTPYHDVRASFYSIGWTGAANSTAATQMTAMRAKALTLNPALALQPNSSRFYWSEDKSGVSSVTGYIADATDSANNGQPEKDHITPLGIRWKSGTLPVGTPAGNNISHPARVADYQLDIQVISKKTNLAKSGPRFVKSVGPNFRGPLDV